jgi:hypothetical protein
MRPSLIIAVCAILSALPGWSQARTYSPDATSGPPGRLEVFGGFSLAGGGAPEGADTTGTDYGFNGGAAFHLISHVFLVADVSQFFHPQGGVDTTSDTAFLLGPRYWVPVGSNSRLSVFGEFLAGGDTYHNNGQFYTFRYNNATTFAMAAEGGLDYALSRHLTARFEGGYLHSTLDYSTYAGPANPAATPNNRGRFAVDMVYRF